MKRMIRPSDWVTSLRTALSRSSNSPRNLVPATSAPMSSAITRRFCRLSGTSPETMRWASPSTMAVLPTAASAESSSAIPSRCRTISASAQNATPSPYDRHRPRCHHTSAAKPSMYFSNSQPSLDLPTPGGPDTSTRRGIRRSAAAWNSSLMVRSSASRPVSGASRPSTRWTPPTADSTRVTRHSRCGSALPFKACCPASANPTPRPASRYVAPSVSTWPGSATVWIRAAVFTASPATIPSPTAPRLTAT